jgi:hypothetical protein
MKNKAILILGFILAFSACEDDSQEPIIEAEENSFISFNPTVAAWYQRTAPDSFIVDISGETPPYFISERGSKVDAQIKGNKLILFPKSYTEPFDRLKKTDFINISDNAGNVNTLNINLDILFYEYKTVEKLSLDLTGDTNISVNQLNIRENYWDAFRNYLSISLTTPNSGVDPNGTVELDLFLESPIVVGANRVEYFNNRGFDYYICTKEYVLKRSDTVYVTALTKNEVKLNFDFDVGFTLFGSIFGNYRLKGDIELSN